jgi:ABC-type transport system involved in multi-copper enzyme maturation permease subunit
MFPLATLVIERDFLSLNHLGEVLADWLAFAGPASIVGLLVLMLLRMGMGRGNVLTHGLTGMLDAKDEAQSWKLRVLVVLGGATLLGMIFLVGYMSVLTFQDRDPWKEMAGRPALRYAWLSVSGLAVATLSWEFLVGLFTMSGRRLWAIARFSMIEALRKKVLWGFGLLLLVFLFGSWFISSSRVETQWATYVNLVYFILAGLMLITASTVACFSIPNDIRMQSIHTMVTKPVQKFEVVLGRILGLVLLMTVVLLAAALLSLLYIIRGVDERVRQAALRAREPVFGNMVYQQLNPEMGVWETASMGTFIGREFDLRQYIRGGSNQEAVWMFGLEPKSRAALSRLARRDWVSVEFAFDIFRTSKGGAQVQEGVDVQFTFVNRAKWDDARYGDYREAKDASGLPLPPQEKARKFGYYEPRPVRVTDEKTDYDTLLIPGALFEGMPPGSVFEVRVGCRSNAQYLGCYRYDLYLLDAEGNFLWNYLKGATSIWFFMVLVVVLGVVFSTYLNAPVSLMLVWLFLLAGTGPMRSFIATLTQDPSPDNPGGNAMEALYRMADRQALTAPLEQTGTVRVLQTVDQYFFKYLFKGFYTVLPDLGQYMRTMYVANGFNIPADELAMSFILLGIYLFPFLLIGYYLINLREIAG